MSLRLALIALAAALVGLGLWTVGGPEQARAERRDQARMGDLHGLVHHLACLQREGLAPEVPSDVCPGPLRRTDPRTGAPYRIDAVSDRAVRVCAEFETRLPAQGWGTHDGFDPDTGCLTLGTPGPDRRR